MIDIPKMIDRFNRIKMHQESLQTTYVRVPFTAQDLDDLIQLINEYIELRNMVEVWNGIHGQTIAPAGTFDKIYNEAEEDDIND